MFTNLKRKLPFLVLALLIIAQSAVASNNEKATRKPASPNAVQAISHVLIDINNIAAYISNDGYEFADPYTVNKAGFYWPKPPASVLNNPPIPNTYPTANFSAGIWLTANYASNPNDKRTACAYYTTEFNWGKWNPNGGSLDNTDPTLPSGRHRFRVYKITKGDTVASAANYYDYMEWPYADGAPYLAVKRTNGSSDSIATSPTWLYGKPYPAQRNGQPLNVTGYSSLQQLLSANPPVLTPKIIGDQALWCVYRDLDPVAVPSDAARMFGGPSMRAEVQQYVLGYNSSSNTLGNAVFMDFKIINKSNAVWDSTFIALWDDIDVGNGGTDLMGSDPSRRLAYNYKSTDNDVGVPFAYGINPPAAGMSLLQGPIIKYGGSLGQDTTLGASSIVRFINGGTQNDPSNVGQVAMAVRARDQSGNPYAGLDATGHFEYTGDPEAGTGSLDVASNGGGPQDKRFLIITGSNEGYPIGIPNSHGIDYKMNPGDTAEFVAIVIVAQGTNNLNAVTKLKHVLDQLTVSFGIASAPSGGVKQALGYKLSQNYPNPFNPSTLITYSLPTSGLVTLKVYDVLGREVATLVNEKKAAGSYEATFNAAKLSSGIYFYRLTSNDFMQTKKMILVK